MAARRPDISRSLRQQMVMHLAFGEAETVREPPRGMTQLDLGRIWISSSGGTGSPATTFQGSISTTLRPSVSSTASSAVLISHDEFGCMLRRVVPAAHTQATGPSVGSVRLDAAPPESHWGHIETSGPLECVHSMALFGGRLRETTRQHGYPTASIMF